MICCFPIIAEVLEFSDRPLNGRIEKIFTEKKERNREKKKKVI
jgi:hypothetical protein